MNYHNENPLYSAPFYREFCGAKDIIGRRNLLKVEGVGSVKTTPDVASIFLGVISENNKLTAAQTENAEKISSVINSLLKIGVNEKDIKTENYSVDPQYDFVEGKQIFRGYRVTNNIRVTVRDMKSIGRIIDTAIENGANVVYNVNFSLSNRDIYYRKALSLALINAVEKANSIEKTLSIEVNTTPIEIIEDTSNSNEPRALYTLKAPASPTPIMTGEIEVAAKVNLVFKYMAV